MNKIIFFIIVLLSSNCFSQKVQKDFQLSKILDETSGLEIVDDLFITQNDSGNDPIIYYIDFKGKIVNQREIIGFENNDWEDLAVDDQFIYIADMGNNYDTRKNLSIIKIPKKSDSNDNFESINFKYPEQSDFSYKRLSEFDAEALISIENNLLIFTKNRAKKISDIYILPKTKGEYDAKKIGSLNTKSIVTGGDFNSELNLLALTSTISFDEYYLLIIKNFSLSVKNDYEIDMYEIPIGKTQVEAIKIIDENTFWITSEDESSSSSARLMKIKL